jgi:parallel beta-helix repeat protein
MKGKDGWKKTKAFLMTTFILSISLSSFLTNQQIQASTLFIESSDLLQEKINESFNGDIIQINSSIVLTNYVIINKSIILQGIDSNVNIDGADYGLNITTNNLTIKNITIYNCSTAITIKNSSHSLENITLCNVNIQNCSNHGINIYNTTLSNISRTTIFNCTSSGIYLQNSTNLYIYNNIINHTGNTGINLTELSNNNMIKNNTFTHNSISINVTFSENNTFYNNTFFNSTIYHVNDNSINNWNTTTYGNYWDDYTGTDANNDNLGDSPYFISGGSNSDEKPLGFFVPIVNFSYEPTSPTTANTIIFTDNSSDPNNINNDLLIYNWNFGDGNTSTNQNPTHSYSDDGMYLVTLNVTNSYQQWNSTNQTITVTNLGPTSSFSWSPHPGIVNGTISFTDSCSDPDGAIESWFWDFGDGNTSTEQNPTHSFVHAGDYTVILNVTDDDGNVSSDSETVTITFKPSVNFSTDTSNPTTSDTITFTDTSIDSDGSIAARNWSFGDGTYSEKQNPKHSYSDDGTYSVTLNVTDNDGASNQTTQELTALNTPPIANFSYTPQNPTDLQTVTFTNNSLDTDGHIANCTWTFGDGTTNYSMNTTSHRFEDNGTYTVTLNVTDDDGDTNEYSVNINVSNVEPTAGFTFEPSYPKVGETIWFNSTSSDSDGTLVNWSWSFDDNSHDYSKNTSHSYSKLDSYDVTLTIKDNDGNTSSITKHLILKSTTTESITSSKPVTYDLKDEADAIICLKTTNVTNLSVNIYSECPSNVEKNIQNYENLETYTEIILEDNSLLEWVNFSLYYTENDIDNDIDETSLTIFYWNNTNEEWVQIPDCYISTSDTGSYSGFVQANISHLTLFTIAGTIIEEEDTPSPTLPSIVNSSNNTVFVISTPTLNITYDQVVPAITATLNGTSIPIDTIDNKTFIFFINTDLSNGNYTIQLHLTNGSLSRNDRIYFNINLPSTSKTTHKPISIPVWIWYGLIFFLVIIAFWFFNLKEILFKFIFHRVQPLTAKDITTETKRPSQGLIKDTLNTLQQSLTSFDAIIFGTNDPWEETKIELNHTMYNIDLFTEKPDVYVGIQERILNEEPMCMKIINLLDHNISSLETIKKKTSLSKEDLGKELSVLLKYGLINEQQNSFQLSDQAKKLLKEKEEK